MSAMPTTITIDPVAATIARAYGEMAYGLARLTSAVQLGDLAGLLPPRPAPAVAPARPVVVLAPPAHHPADQFFTAMASELLKTGVVVLVVYQGLLSLLPAPERPTFAPIAAEASPSGSTVVPSVNPAAHRAAGGQQHGQQHGGQQEVGVDGDGRSRFTAVP